MATTEFRENPTPPTALLFKENIRFLHPGYPEPNTLISLPPVDRTPTGVFGVHHRTALLACQIIGNNSFDTGYLTLDQAGQQHVNTPLDAILTEKVYYFVIGSNPDRYAVVPSFRDWKFPHGRIPDSWPQVTSPYGEYRCGITNFSRALESAHLVPKEEADWYLQNDMSRYGLAAGVSDIGNPVNLLPLRADMHRIFDARGFAIVPKMTEAETDSFQYVTHILTPREAEFWPAHHNIVVQHLHSMSHPYLFARFAWSILLHAKDFVIGRQRLVSRLHIATDEDGFETKEYKTEVLDAKQLMQRYGGGGSKAATKAPTSRGKRSRTDSTMDDDSMESSDDSVEVIDDMWDVVDDAERGGKRRKPQESSEETAPSLTPALPPDVDADLRKVLRQGIAEHHTSQDAQEVQEGSYEIDMTLSML